MRELAQVLNDYPWTFILLAIYVLFLIDQLRTSK